MSRSRSRLTRPVQIGLLTPYFSFFDERFPASFRQSQQSYAAQLVAALNGPGSNVVPSGLVDSPESAATAGAIFRKAEIDVIVVAPLMAAPPGFVVPLLAGLQRPIVLWLDDRLDLVADGISEMDATRYSNLLGLGMLSAALRGAGVPFYVQGSSAGDGAPIVRAARGAAARTMLAGLRIGVLGEPIPGYADVLLHPAAASSLGVSVEMLDADVYSPSYADFDSARAQFWPEFSRNGAVLPDAEAGLSRSLAFTCDLERTVRDQDLDVLVINCHSRDLRSHPERGIVGCLGASVLTTAGVPVSCTGDGATAVALAVATWVAGSSQYAEGYVIGRSTGDLLISSCGLANLELREPSQPLQFRGNDLYPGAQGLGCCVRMAFRNGPATILALGANSPSAQPRFVWTIGFMSGRYFPEMNGPSGTFSFDPPGDRSVSTRWINAAPAHHVAVMPGHLDLELSAAATFVNAEFVMAGANRESTV